jgi:hypothetical protein
MGGSVMTQCEGDWNSHRWEINQHDSLLFCNQCGCEIGFELEGGNHQWEVEAVNEEANTVSLYCVGCLKVSFDAKVRWATA